MNGNVTREGIDADLTAMRDIGLGGALMFDGSNDVPKGPVNYISPHWLDLMTHMAAKAQDLGLKVGLHNAPGWSSSGGRSEEHTSELQSLMRISYAVFCLKKKNYIKNSNNDQIS